MYKRQPEHKYPQGFEACYAAVEWAFAHAAELGVSRKKLCVSGDSAGGNLSLACSLRDRDEGKGMIAYQALIYPTVSRLEKVGAARYWKPELYDCLLYTSEKTSRCERMNKNMKLGIVGLPNVGKSTLFNAITNAGAQSANYPFCTIEPNVGVVAVPDARLDRLAEMYHPKKYTPATIEFVDIAGLVKGASKGEGLGNKFPVSYTHLRRTPCAPTWWRIRWCRPDTGRSCP